MAQRFQSLLGAIIFLYFNSYVKACVLIFGGDASCLLPVSVCIDAYVMIDSYECQLFNYTLATEDNVGNVRVCTCCNHFPIT